MLEQYISKFWTQIFTDSLFINALLSGTEDMYDQQTLDTATLYNALSRHTIDVYRKQKWIYVTYDEDDMNQDAMQFNQEAVYFNGLYNFGDRLHNYFTFPIDSNIEKIPFIMSGPKNPEIVLESNVDYYVDNDRNLIFFRDNPFNMGFDKRFIDTSGEPILGISMWFFGANKDFKDVEDIYGEVVRIGGDSSEYFKKIVNDIWDLRVEGGTINNVNKLLCHSVDTDFITTGGTYTRTFTEGGRIWAEIGSNLYSAPTGVSITKDILDTITDGEMIFDSVQVFTGRDDIPYSSFPANIDYPFPSAEDNILVSDGTGYFYVEDISATAYTYLADNVSGFIIDLLVSDATLTYTFVTSRGGSLPFKGRDSTVLAFNNHLLGLSASLGRDLTDIIIEDNNNKVPDTINLFTEYQQRAFLNNAFFVTLSTEYVPDNIDPAVFLTYIKFTIPAYTTMLTFMEAGSTLTYNASNISETVEAFHTQGVSDSYSSTNITDNVTRKTSI